MITEIRHYRLTGKTPILGSKPSDPAVHSTYIAAKAPDPITAKLEEDALPDEEDATRGVTVFLRDDDGALVLCNYQLLGFFKAAGQTLKDQITLCQARSKMDQFVFIGPRFLRLTHNGAPIMTPARIYERPLRGETPKGPRVALASSEMVDEWQIECSIELVKNEPTTLKGATKSAAVTFDMLEGLLEYGRLKGLGQNRNSSFGQFTFERLL